MDINKRLELVKRNTVEIIGEEELKGLLEGKGNPSVYCGYEVSWPLHLGHFVTMVKLMDLEKARFNVKILLADIHTMLNRKGSEEEIKKEVELWKKVIKAIGLKAEVVLGSDFQFDKDYVIDVMRLAQGATINRGLRSMQEIARDVKNATISQLWYPLMQVADVKALGVDVALGGLEQRKVHMIGNDMAKTLGYNFISIHTGLINSLKGPGGKMSSSVPGSLISVLDSKENIKKKIKEAYCPAKKVEDNPILQIVRLIIFPLDGKFEIKRDKKFGGDVSFDIYEGLEKAYSRGEVHPLDLKNAVVEGLERVVGPIRKGFR